MSKTRSAFGKIADDKRKFFFKKFWSSRLRIIENHLRKIFTDKNFSQTPSVLKSAMSYSVMLGGKRLRPILTMAAAEVAGFGARAAILDGACAVELIHTYSLIHDDLPALDNDDYRRGKLSSHKKFGEDMAILAGDALLTMAFELLSRSILRLRHRLDAKSAATIIAKTAMAAGKEGMVGGQVADVKYSSEGLIKCSGPVKKSFFHPYRRILNYIHLNKTARLIELSAVLGGLLAGASEKKNKALAEYGRKIGLAFQITDDLLDDSPHSSDTKNFRLTYPALYGKKEALKKARELASEAVRAISIFPKNSAPKLFLEMLADFIVNRKK